MISFIPLLGKSFVVLPHDSFSRKVAESSNIIPLLMPQHYERQNLFMDTIQL